MLFQRFEDNGLSHYSYILACPGAGEAVVVDPRRDFDEYLEFAEREGLKIVAVLETHIHADFASGASALASLTGATHYASAYDAGETFELQTPHVDMRDGDQIKVGPVRIEAMHTPGHTPEHLSFLVYDEARSAEHPMLLLSGDFLFVGSLGRPDLLGDEAKRALAHQLFASVQRLSELPDGIEVHPAHGAGSMCGAGMSGRPMSTLGFERIANPYLDPNLDEATFVEKILGSVPPFPDYYRRMKRVNSEGPTLLDGLPGQEALDPSRLDAMLLKDDGALVIDLRDQVRFGAGHIPGAFGIGGDERLSTWASWMVPYDRPIVLFGVEPGSEAAKEAARRLIRVGHDSVVGVIQGGMEAWRAAGFEEAQLPQLSPSELAEKLSEDESLVLIDVREHSEFEDGHVAGALSRIGGEIAKDISALPNHGRTLALICNSGYRSTVAGSVLLRAGVDRVCNVTGGMVGWQAAGLAVDHPS
jgi:hydroxyacylglutathione hydrolase